MSYVSISEADAYFENRLEAQKWQTLTDDDKTVYLNTAFIHLEALPWIGEPVDPDGNKWPRIIDGKELMPREIPDAQCEIVIRFLNHEELFPAAINRRREEHLEVEYVDGATAYSIILNLIGKYLYINSVPVTRV